MQSTLKITDPSKILSTDTSLLLFFFFFSFLRLVNSVFESAAGIQEGEFGDSHRLSLSLSFSVSITNRILLNFLLLLHEKRHSA